MKREPPKELWIHCNHCSTETRHLVLFHRDESHTPKTYPPMQIDWAHGTCMVCVCAGCDTVSFVEEWSTSEEPEPTRNIYPERKHDKISPKMFLGIPFSLSAIYEEVIESFNAECLTLCGAGLRALLEGICADRGIMAGPVQDSTGKTTMRKTLEGKINGLTRILPGHIVRNLHAFRFLGNEALHRLKRPGKKDVALAIEVMEDIVNFLYELDYKSSRLHKHFKKPSPARSGDGGTSGDQDVSQHEETVEPESGVKMPFTTSVG